MKKISNNLHVLIFIIEHMYEVRKSWLVAQTEKQGTKSAKFHEITANLRQIDEKLDLERNFSPKKLFFAF